METTATTGQCDLRDLARGRPGLSAAKGASLAEAAAVCLASQKHKPGVMLKQMSTQDTVEGPLEWTPAGEQQKHTYADIAEATEEGACAIALTVLEVARGLVVTERSRKCSAFDYWLGNEPGFLFQRKARLEVTGILKGGSKVVESRMTEKLQRFESYPHKSPAIVVVVEFGTPLVRIDP